MDIVGAVNRPGWEPVGEPPEAEDGDPVPGFDAETVFQNPRRKGYHEAE